MIKTYEFQTDRQYGTLNEKLEWNGLIKEIVDGVSITLKYFGLDYGNDFILLQY